jgi:hypothetical protein
MRPLPALLLLAACDFGTGTKPKGKAPAAVEDAQIFRAQLEMKTLAAELAQHHAMRGEWPKDWRAIRRSGKDPWGNDYAFEADGEQVSVFSAGPDGEFGTDDDLAGG